MTHSLIGADRTSHLKIVSVALAGAIAVVVVGFSARVSEHDTATARAQTATGVLKAGKPGVFTARDTTAFR